MNESQDCPKIPRELIDKLKNVTRRYFVADCAGGGDISQTFYQGWRQELSDGGLTLPTRGLKYGFQGTINAKNLPKNRFSPSDGGLAFSNEGAIAP